MKKKILQMIFRKQKSRLPDTILVSENGDSDAIKAEAERLKLSECSTDSVLQLPVTVHKVD